MRIRTISVLALILLDSCPSSWAGFPASINCGSGIMRDEVRVAQVSFGTLSGFTFNSQTHNRIGYFDYSKAAYQTFLNSDHPLAVHPEPAQAASSKYIVSPDRTMRLSWSDGSNPLPVQYRVYVGQISSGGRSSSGEMRLMGTTDDRFFVLQNLAYLEDYYWQIEAFDTYGRATMSAAFSFSIAPGVGHLYCAPNPFRAGSEATTFIFNMSGPGWAKLSIYSLPSIGLVYSTSLDNLQAGVNTHVYDGMDGGGRSLYNGVYMAILDKKGSEDETERFKFLVVH